MDETVDHRGHDDVVGEGLFHRPKGRFVVTASGGPAESPRQSVSGQRGAGPTRAAAQYGKTGRGGGGSPRP